MNIEIRNRFNVQKRDISIYHHDNRSAKVVGPGNSGDFLLEPEKQGDYIYLSLVKGTGDLWKEGWILVPGGIDFDFASRGKFRFQRTATGDKFKLIIPAGLQEWELKLTVTGENGAAPPSNKENIIICGDGPVPGKVN